MNRLRVGLLILFATLPGCGGSSQPVRTEGILISWLAEANKSVPCVVVANKPNSDRLLSIAERGYGCSGRRKVIAHYPSGAGLARILSTLPTNPKSQDSNSDTYPWHVIRLDADGVAFFRLGDDEAQLLFKSIAEDSPRMREEIEGRLIHAASENEAGQQYRLD